MSDPLPASLAAGLAANLLTIALAAVLTLPALMAACRALRAVDGGIEDLDRLLLALPLAQAALGTLFLLLALAGSLSAPAVGVGLLGMAVLGGWRALRSITAGATASARSAWRGLPLRLRLLAAMGALPLVAALSGALLPPFGVDAPAYVHSAARWLLRERPVAEASVLDHVSLNVEGVCALALVLRQALAPVLPETGAAWLWDGAEAGALVNGLVMVCGLGLLYRLGRRLGYGRSPAMLGVLAFGLTPAVAEMPALLKSDVAWLALTVASLLLLLGAGEPRARLLAGICLGAAYGAKQLAILSALGLLPVLVLLWRRGRGASLLPLALGAFLAAAPWPVKNLIVSGGPAWPLPPLLPDARPPGDLLGRVSLLAEAGILRSVPGEWWRAPEALWDVLGPAMHRVEPESGFGPLLLAALPLLLLHAPSRRRALPLLWFGAAFFLCWQAGPQQGRYLFPAFALLCLPASDILYRLGRTGGAVGWTSRLVLAGWCLSAAGMTLLLSLQWLPAALGFESRPAFLSRAVTAYADQVRMRGRLQPGARVFLIDDLGPYYLWRDTVLGSTRWQANLDPTVSGIDEIHARLHALGVTHVYSANPNNLDASMAVLPGEDLAASRYRTLLERLPLEESFPDVPRISPRLISVAARGRLYRLVPPSITRMRDPSGRSP